MPNLAKHLFSTFDVSRQVFYRSALSLAIVNLKPLLPGHVLVLPKRVVPRLADLDAAEVSDLFLSVQTVGRVVESAYSADALTISLQDGVHAGQSVPHVHVHILARRQSDFGGHNDDVYPALEASEGELEADLARFTSAPDEPRPVGQGWNTRDEDRQPRSMDEMEREALWLAGLFS